MASSVSGAVSGAGSRIGSGLATAGGVVGISLGADWAEGNGLDRAEAAAGDVLRPLFGGQVPWEMSSAEIVDAVVPNFLPDFVPGAAESASAMIDVALLVI